MSLQQPENWTEAQYLAFERSQPEKNEFIDGQIIPQTIDTFSEYLLVTQDGILLKHFVRHSDSLWSFEVVTERSALT